MLPVVPKRRYLEKEKELDKDYILIEKRLINASKFRF